MKHLYLLCLLWLIPQTAIMAQDKPAYQLFDGKGKSLKYKKLLKSSSQADVVMFGEYHNNPIAHWLELELFRDLIEARGASQMVLGAEMFEQHQQEAIDAYVAGTWTLDQLNDSTKMWSNFDTDYLPVLDLAKDSGITVVATNVPRKYARMVSKQGQEALLELSEEEKALMVPLPYPVDFELSSYQEMMGMMAGHGDVDMSKNFVSAQAIKDATMAHFLLKAWKPGQLAYHLNGSFHSNYKQGIVWYLLQAQPELDIVNIAVVEQSQVDTLEDENQGLADFIIVVPETMTKTYLQRF
ncbi:ChaN family lipoprotein [Pontibacter sp. G13]|uniref:ChaN family lipoprotein n=1 Tax=Pontibacter sp. G13 TaxID=3074898 RepID=UPI00288A3136|nr:ChaN family lipoprotein [Pontibacter sp. G13]WNJ17800.1 ChaN family lipoprotein [Pontibacter sp. G13]